MKITVFGADGQTGRLVVAQASKRGHIVTGFIHDAGNINTFPSHVRIFCNDVANAEVVKESIIGSNAIISTLGHIKNSDPFIQTKGIQNIVTAMTDLGVTRIISLTGTGARIPTDSPSLWDEVINFFVHKIDPARIQDGIEHMKVLARSNLNWTVLRVLKLNNNQKTVRKYKLTSGGPAEFTTSRKKVAHIMVDLAESNEYSQKAPVVSG